jgi:1-aminocyclopropane-1-carboxylate deaminase
MLLDISSIEINKLTNKLFDEKQISLSIVRLDKIHPVISGNKLFKLHYFLKEALESDHKTILTFGGAYSNHLVATAYACKIAGLKSIGIVRGENPLQLSYTLQTCSNDGMQLKFISRNEYSQKGSDEFIKKLISEFGECVIVPEGGYHPLGAKGAALIMDILQGRSFTHICSAVGTATTIAGLLLAAEEDQRIVSIPVLKGMRDIKERILFLTEDKGKLNQLMVLDEYHFGGYAKYTTELIDFMNNIFEQYRIPTDLVYTAKMLFAIFDSIKKDIFPKGSKIACLHTGGLQGNLSLSEGRLIF